VLLIEWISEPRLNEYLDIPERGFTNICLPRFENGGSYRQVEGYDDFYVLPAGVPPCRDE
jgi:hypothetical protein